MRHLQPVFRAATQDTHLKREHNKARVLLHQLQRWRQLRLASAIDRCRLCTGTRTTILPVCVTETSLTEDVWKPEAQAAQFPSCCDGLERKQCSVVGRLRRSEAVARSVDGRFGRSSSDETKL